MLQDVVIDAMLKLLFYPIGVVRIALFLIIVTLILVGVLATSWLPIKVRGIHIASWLCTFGARAALGLFGMRLKFRNASRLSGFGGFVLANHCTFVDILLLIALAPGRFLAAAEVGRWPIIGLIARTIGTIFVKREDRDSRKASRAAILAAPKYPPLMIFPQGGIHMPGNLPPFRFGAFELCIETGSALLPCAIKYDPPDVMAWYSGNETGREEALPTAVWRMATYPGVKRAEVTVMEPLQTKPGDDAPTLARRTYDAIVTELGWRNQMTGPA